MRSSAAAFACSVARSTRLCAAAKADEIDLERERIEAQKEIAGMQVGAKVAAEKAKFEGDMQIKGLEIGSKIAKDRMDIQQTESKQPTKKGD